MPRIGERRWELTSQGHLVSPGEFWICTGENRFIERDGKAVLQQRLYSDCGNVKWEDVPVVKED